MRSDQLLLLVAHFEKYKNFCYDFIVRRQKKPNRSRSMAFNDLSMKNNKFICLKGRREMIMDSFIKYALARAGLNPEGYSVPYQDLDRIYVDLWDDEYIIRMWNISQEGVIDFTVYRFNQDHGERLVSGRIQLTEDD